MKKKVNGLLRETGKEGEREREGQENQSERVTGKEDEEQGECMEDEKKKASRTEEGRGMEQWETGKIDTGSMFKDVMLICVHVIRSDILTASGPWTERCILS